MNSQILYLQERFNKAPGVAMPPLQVYAAYLALHQPPYNTGLFKALDGQAVIRIDDLVARAAVAAKAVGMSVPRGFERESGRILLDTPQVASILSSALDDLFQRYGDLYSEVIAAWAHEAFGSLLPLLDDENKQAGIEYLSKKPQDPQMANPWAFIQAKETCIQQLKASQVVNAVDFLIRRAQALRETNYLSIAV